MKLAYGNHIILFDEKNMTDIIHQSVSGYARLSFESVMEDGVLCKSLKKLKPETVAIIVEDQTRKNPEYPEVLAYLLQMLEDLWHEETKDRVFLIVAYGTHKKHTEETDLRLYGKENLEKTTIIHHDCYSDDLVLIGHEDFNIWINKHVAEADFVMTIGSVKPHAFAGFTGGRKAILPGVASYNDIRNNHAKVIMDHVKMGELEKNPIHLDMEKRADLLKVHYSIQMLKDKQGQLVNYYCGDQKESFYEATKMSRLISSEKSTGGYDVAVVSVGGLPKDATLYQSQRAITTATDLVHKQGTVFMVAELKDGVGNQYFEEWLPKPIQEIMSIKAEQIEIGVHSAFLMARNLSQCAEIYLLTAMDETWCEKYHFKKINDLKDIDEICKEKYGDDYKSVLLMNGSDIMIEIEA